MQIKMYSYGTTFVSHVLLLLAIFIATMEKLLL